MRQHKEQMRRSRRILPGNHLHFSTFGIHPGAVVEGKVSFFQKAEPIGWAQLTLGEHIVLMAMTVEPQREVEWLIQRALCFHGLGEITPHGIRLTYLGRKVIAERHGLPVVVGRDPKRADLASGFL
jgi:hypothetical protein